MSEGHAPTPDSEARDAGSRDEAGGQGARATAAPPSRQIRWPAFVVVLVVGVSLGIAGFTFDHAEGLSYLSDDPKACINCHVMQEYYDAWSHASHHANATCNDCHVPHDSVVRKYMVKAEQGYRHSKGFTFNDFHEPIQITKGSRDVVIENCMRCHASIAGDLSAHAPPARGEASPASLGVDCLHCHVRAGHGPPR
ncbi:MAG: cytochrome c nitrite reductase small subunit [Planctomycetota bacterium]|nr:cytochrome c nitrite reductase small subunit [Planctomycetota bacterium]